MKLKVVTLLALSFILPGLVSAAVKYQDTVYFKKGGRPQQGSIRTESLKKGVGIDSDGDGRADLFYPVMDISRIEYDDSNTAVTHSQRRAKRSLKSNDYASAAKYFMKAAEDPQIRPNLRDYVKYQAGQCYMRLGEYKKAINAFKGVDDDYRLAPEAKIGTMQASIILGDIKSAESAINEMKKFPKKDFETLTTYWQSRVAFIKKNYSAAKQGFDKVSRELKLRPVLAIEAMIYSALCQFEKTPDAGLATLKKAEKSLGKVNDPVEAKRLLSLLKVARGRLYYAKKDYWKALFQFKKVALGFREHEKSYTDALAGLAASAAKILETEKPEGLLKEDVTKVLKSSWGELSVTYKNSFAAKRFSQNYPTVKIK